MSADNGKPLTGRKVLAIALGAFGLVIGANLALLFSATGTFPGLVVANSYVASQVYEAERAAQAATGWILTARQDGKRLTVTVTDAEGAPVAGLSVTATVGRPASDAEDVALTLTPAAEGYVAELPVEAGRWRVEYQATAANGAMIRAHSEIFLEGA